MTDVEVLKWDGCTAQAREGCSREGSGQVKPLQVNFSTQAFDCLLTLAEAMRDYYKEAR